MDTKKQFDTIVHDLQSPFTVIQGYVRSPERLQLTPEETEQYRQAAQLSLEKMKTLFEELRHVVRQLPG